MRVFEAQEHWSWWGRRFRLPVRPMPEYRRRLPHFQPEDAYLFLTWRLWGSLPEAVKLVSHRTQGQAFVAQDRALDRRCSGPLWLKQPRIAALVAEAIQMGEGERHFYELAAWVVMPNHVHLLILPKVPVPILMRWLKGSTARHSIQRDRIIAYIEENPVSAGLFSSAELWPCSSAGWQANPPAPPDLPSVHQM